MRKLEPALGWVVVRKELPQEKTDGGIIKPASVLERETGMQAGEECSCTVVAIPGGPAPWDDQQVGAVGVKTDGSRIYPEVGDRVMVMVRGDNAVAYWDDQNPAGLVTTRNGRERMAQLYFVKLEAIVGVVNDAPHEGEVEVG